MPVGATPIFVDIDPRTYTLNPACLAAAITPATCAIIPVHLYGQLADMTRINQIAKTHKLAVIEDAAQAHGATWQGKLAGNLADAACFSFYPGKNLGLWGCRRLDNEQRGQLPSRCVRCVIMAGVPNICTIKRVLANGWTRLQAAISG